MKSLFIIIHALRGFWQVFLNDLLPKITPDELAIRNNIYNVMEMPDKVRIDTYVCVSGGKKG